MPERYFPNLPASSHIPLTLPVPDILGIGVQRGGCKWLGWLLHTNDNILIPPLLDLHFFNRLVFRRGAAWSGIGAQKRAAEALNRYLASRSKPDQSWLSMLTTLVATPEGSEWYSSVLAGLQARPLQAEVTADYCLLPEAEIKALLSVNPDLKFVLILRDPVERVLSQLAEIHNAAPKVKPHLSQIAKEESVLGRSRYETFIPLWRDLIPESQLFIARTESIASKPTAFVADLASFLGCPPEKFDPSLLSRRQKALDNANLLNTTELTNLRLHLGAASAYLEKHFPT